MCGETSALNLNFTPSARSDLAGIHRYIAAESDRIADNVVSRLRESIETLRVLPMAGRPGRVEGTREWSVPSLPYFVVYVLTSETDLDVLAIIHERRDYPYR